jgi:hypothetical protein
LHCKALCNPNLDRVPVLWNLFQGILKAPRVNWGHLLIQLEKENLYLACYIKHLMFIIYYSMLIYFLIENKNIMT